MFRPLVTILVVLLLCPALARATDRFVSKVNASDSNPCTSALPCATPSRALSIMNGGDRVIIRAGLYTSGAGGLSLPNGSAGAYSTIMANPGDTVTLRPGGGGEIISLGAGQHHIAIDGLILDGGDAGGVNRNVAWIIGNEDHDTGANGHDFIIRNCEVKNGHQHGLLIGGANWLIQNNHIHHNGTDVSLHHGLYFAGSDSLIIGNTFDNNACTAFQNFVSQGDADTSRNTYKNNIFTQNGCGSILEQGSGHSFINNIVYNDGTLGNGGNDGNTNEGALTCCGDDTVVYHNTFANNIKSAVGGYDSNNTSIQWRNNIICGSSGVGSLGNVTASNNTTSGTCSGFQSAGAGNFHRTSELSVPCLGSVTTDFDGAARPGTDGVCTGGAFEFAGGAADTTPPTVTITGPVSTPTFSTAATSLTTFAGGATDNVGVTSVTWTCPTCTPTSGTATCPSCGVSATSVSWSVGSVGLQLGSNVLSAIAHDAAGMNSPADTLTVTRTAPVPTASLGATPTSIASGQFSTLTWSSTNATSCTGTGFSTGNTTSGSVNVSPTVTTTYSVSCTGTGGTSPAATATVTVTGPLDTTPPVVTITGPVSTPTFSTGTSPLTTFAGSATDNVGVTSVTWSCPTCTPTGGTATCATCGAGATSVSWSVGSIGLQAGSNVLTVVAHDAAAVANPPPDTLTVTMTSTPPTASLSALPTSIASGQSSVLTWGSTNATTCAGTGFSTAGTTSGTLSVSPAVTTVYSVSCTGAGGTSPIAAATVTVTGGGGPVVFVDTNNLGGTASDATACGSVDLTHPRKTLAGGLACLVSTGTLYLRAGTYAEAINSDTQTINGGTSFAQPTTISAYQNEVVRLAPTSGFSVVSLFSSLNTYIILYGLGFDGLSARDRAVLIGGSAHHIRVQQCDAHHSTLSIVKITDGSAFNEILSCLIHDGVTDEANGIYMDASVQDTLISGNTIYNYGEHGILDESLGGVGHGARIVANRVRDPLPTGGPGIAVAAPGALVANNVIANGTVCLRTSAASTTLYNNTCVTNSSASIEVQAGASGTQVVNNLLYNSQAISNAGSGTVFTTNFCSTAGLGCALTGNPLFVNAATGDYDLQTGSPARNVGTTLAAVPTDILGRTRPQPAGGAYDIGAYEGLTGPTDTTPPVVTITGPTSSPTFSTGTSPLTTFSGGATDNIGVTSVTWTNDRGGSGTATCPSCGPGAPIVSWSVPSIALQTSPPANVLTVVAHDAATNNSTPVTLAVTLTVSPPTASLTATPSTITAGQSSTLSWSSTFATSCTGTGFSTGNTTSGSLSVSPTVTTTYSVSCSGTGGTANSNATVTVTPPADTTPPVVTITGPVSTPTFSTGTSPLTTFAGSATDNVGVTSVTWTCPTCTPTSGTAACATCGAGATSVSWSVGSIGLQLGDNVLTAIAHDAAGMNSPADTLTVTLTAPPPTASLSALPTSITVGGSSTLTWSSTNATSCTGTGFSTGTATSGSLSVSPTVTTTYSVSCSGTGGTANSSATVTVTPAPDTTPPVVTITGPVSTPTFSTGTSPLTTFAGTATDNVGVTSVTWTCPTCTPTSGTATCTTCGATGTPAQNVSWSVSSIALQAGSNVLTVIAHDAANLNSPADTLTVTLTNPAPTASLTATPSTIAPGGSSTLNWNSTNATTCAGTGFSTAGTTSGTLSVSPAFTTQYSVLCSGAGGSAPATATVTVTGAPGPVVFVDTNNLGGTASDATACASVDLTHPRKTLAGGLACLVSGGTLYLRAGTYAERLDSSTQTIPGGTSWAQPTTISAYQNEAVTLAPTTASPIVSFGASINSYIVLYGLNLNGLSAAARAVAVSGPANHIRVQQCDAHHTTASTLYSSGSAGNEFLNSTVHDSQSNGIYMDASAQDTMVSGNTVYNYSEYGIFDESAGTGAQIVGNRVRDPLPGSTAGIGVVSGIGDLLVNNLVTNGTVCIIVGAASINVGMYNNTCATHSSASVQILSTASGTQVVNNLLYNSQAISNAGSGTVFTTNFCSTAGLGCALTGNPLFVNAATGDYDLQASSPARNVGTTLAAVPTDILGRTRPQPAGGAYDIGAYESIPTTVPTASLTATPSTITVGQTSTLTWSSTNATSCVGTGFSTGGSPGSSLNVSPTVTTTYSVSCTGTGGTSPTASATVTVNPAADTTPPQVLITNPTSSGAFSTATPSLTTLGGTATDNVGVTSVTWTCPTCTPTGGTASCTTCGLSGPSAQAVSWSVSSIALQAGANVLTVVANDAATNTSTPATLTVTLTPPPPTASLTATPSTIALGQTSTLNWSSTNATSCTGAGFSTGGTTLGSLIVSPTTTTTYNMSCTGGGGTANSNATVTVSGTGTAAVGNPAAGFFLLDR
jgi:Right handed beta helix region/Periplasmic copper-binding protein (NosD)